MSSAPQQTGRGSSTRRLLVGRDAELEELGRALKLTDAGRGSLYLLSGEPGIGKTRLSDEASQLATELGIDVLWGRCWEAGGAPAYWPWLDVLEALFTRTNDVNAAALGDGAATLAALVKGLSERWPTAAAPISDNPEQARFRLYRAVLSLLRRATSQRALLIVLEDLHAADESSLLLLHFLARELRSARICILGTFRDVEARLSAEVAEALGRLSREGTTLSLARLAEPEAERFVVERLGDVDATTVTQLFRRTQGNPLFLSELVGLLQRQGSHTAAQEALPLGVREVIRQRLSLVSSEDRPLLELAAIAGDEAHAPFLACAALAPEVELHAVLERAAHAGLLLPRQAERYRFSHALVREVLEGDLSAERRRALHANCARVLEAPNLGQEPPYAELAHHLLEAGGAELPRAAEYAIAAAERFLSVFAYEDAIALLERARAAVERDAPGSGLAGRVLVALGRAQLRRGAGKLGQSLCERAVEIARRIDDPALLADAALSYGLEITAALVNPALVKLLEEALAVLPEDDSALRARVTARLAAALQPHPNLEYPIGLAERAIESARRLGDRATLLDAAFMGISAMMDIVDPRQRLPLNLEVEQLASEFGDTERLLRTQARLVFDHMELGDLGAADARINLFERLAVEAGAERYLWRVPLFRSMRAMMHGRFTEAESASEEARRLGLSAKDPLLDRCYVFHREGLLRAWERHDDLIAHDPEARRMRAALYSGPHWQNGGSAFSYARVEDLENARLYLELIPDDDWPLVHNPPAFMHLGEPLALIGREPAARRVYELLSPAAHRCLSWGYTKFVWDGTATRVLALLATRLGLWQQASAFFEQSLEKLTALDAKPYLARTRYEYGRAALEHVDSEVRERGRQSVEAAYELASALDMPGLVRLCERRLAGHGRASRPAPLPKSAELRTAGEPTARATTEPLLSITLEGDSWRVSCGERAFLLRDSLGLRYLAQLVAAPNRGISALELSGGASGPEEPVDTGDAGELLDERARQDYKTRVRELQAELAEAESFSDLGRAARARAELEFLSAELSRAIGLGGRARRAGAASERARSAVQRRIRSAIERIREQSPELGELLTRTVKTGNECLFLPERALPR
ncbi:MAG TPA: AAA family ATPase [Polyangiaceae bacterium]|nr:AAA family ATPase [Polyangiaceae bacterium]